MGRYLDMINTPADVKLLTLDQLQTLAQEIRDELITVPCLCWFIPWYQSRIAGIPAINDFWMISNPPRPLASNARLERGRRPCNNAQPMSLSTALWRPTSSFMASRFPQGRTNRPHATLQFARKASARTEEFPEGCKAPEDQSGNRDWGVYSGGVNGGERRFAARSATGVREEFRFVSCDRGIASAFSSTRTARCSPSEPSPQLRLTISSRDLTMPSVNRKPAANSKSSPGVRIVTVRAWSATWMSNGSSPTSESFRLQTSPSFHSDTAEDSRTARSTLFRSFPQTLPDLPEALEAFSRTRVQIASTFGYGKAKGRAAYRLFARNAHWLEHLI